MIALICFLCSAFAADRFVVQKTEFFRTDCEKSNYSIDGHGVLLRHSDGLRIFGNQCKSNVLSFNDGSSVAACDPIGVDILVIRVIWGQSYFHFVANELQRLLDSSNVFECVNCTVLHNDWLYANTRQQEWLTALNFHAHKYTSRLPGKIRNVFVAPGIDDCASFGGERTIQQLQSRIRASLTLTARRRGTALVWLSRPSGNRRMEMAHQTEAIDYLQSAFQVVFGEPFAAVAILFENSTLSEIYAALNEHTSVLIAGPHGAGFANMILAPSGSLVLEVIPAVYAESMLVQTCFMRAAADCKHAYAVAVAKEGSGFGNDKLTVTSTALLAALYSLHRQKS